MEVGVESVDEGLDFRVVEHGADDGGGGQDRRVGELVDVEAYLRSGRCGGRVTAGAGSDAGGCGCGCVGVGVLLFPQASQRVRVEIQLGEVIVQDGALSSVVADESVGHPPVVPFAPERVQLDTEAVEVRDLGGGQWSVGVETEGGRHVLGDGPHLDLEHETQIVVDAMWARQDPVGRLDRVVLSRERWSAVRDGEVVITDEDEVVDAGGEVVRLLSTQHAVGVSPELKFGRDLDG